MWPVASKEDTRNIATVSSKSEEIGELISDALEKVTKDGVVTVEEGKDLKQQLMFFMAITLIMVLLPLLSRWSKYDFNLKWAISFTL